MEISRYLRQHARTIAGKSQLFINSYAKALEVSTTVIFNLVLLSTFQKKKKKIYTQAHMGDFFNLKGLDCLFGRPHVGLLISQLRYLLMPLYKFCLCRQTNENFSLC